MATLRSLESIVAAIPDGERVLIGIAGPPGAGKSTIAASLVSLLDDAALLPMDGFHLPQAELVRLGRRDRMGAPDTFDRAGFAATLRDLRNAGSDVLAPSFNREIEEAVPGALVIGPAFRNIIVEGNYLLLWEEARDLFDATFFVELDDRIRLARLIDRHVRFGKSPADARAWATGPDEHNAHTIAATARHADHLIALG